MRQLQNSTKIRKYKHLTEKERYKLEALLEQKISCYRADVGQRRYEEKVSNRERSLKIGHDHKLAEYIKEKIIKDKYSPDAIIGGIKIKRLKFDTTICTKTLYNYIDKGILSGISNKSLLWKYRKKKRKHNKVKVCLRNRLGLSIEKRPKNVEKREEYGHWEYRYSKRRKE